MSSDQTKIDGHGEKFARTMANEARMRQHAEEKGIPPLLAFVAGVMFGDEDQRDAAQLGLAMVIGSSLAKQANAQREERVYACPRCAGRESLDRVCTSCGAVGVPLEGRPS